MTPYDRFDAEADAKTLRTAMEGFGVCVCVCVCAHRHLSFKQLNPHFSQQTPLPHAGYVYITQVHIYLYSQIFVSSPTSIVNTVSS